MSLLTAPAPLAALSLIAYDSFLRLNDATTLGTSAETGHAWTANTGTWGINTRAAYLAVTGGGAHDIATVNAGISDGVIRVRMPVYGTVGGFLIFRLTDANNCFMVQASVGGAGLYNLIRKQGGSTYQLAVLNQMPRRGDIIEVHLLQTRIVVYINGVSRFDVTDDFNLTATRHGIASAADTGTLFREFAVFSWHPSPLELQRLQMQPAEPGGTVVTNADADANQITVPSGQGGVGLKNIVYPYRYNGTSWDRNRGDTSGDWVHGPAVEGAAALGGPVRIGGVDSGGAVRTPLSVDMDTGAGVVNALAVTWRKSAALGPEFGTAADPVRVDPTGTTLQPVDSELAAAVAAGDAMANPTTAPVIAHLGMYRPSVSTWYRRFDRLAITGLASAARSATTDSALDQSYHARGIIVFLEIGAASGTGGLQVQVLARNDLTGTLVFLNAAPTAIVATGIYGYEIYPGSSTAGTAGNNQINQRTSAVLAGRQILVRVTHGDASSYTYSVYGYLIP